MQDFNRRHFPFVGDNTNASGTTSPYELTKNCDFYMTMTFRDSGRDFFLTGKAWQDAFYKNMMNDSQTMFQRPMAVVGPWSSHISAQLATLAAVTTSSTTNDDDDDNLGFISISPASATPSLDDRTRYPWFARTQVTPGDIGSQFVTFVLTKLWGVRQFAILYPQTGFGRSVQRGILKHNLGRVFSASYVPGDPESMKEVVALLKSKEFVYYYCVGCADHQLILQLYDAGLMGPGTNTMWMFVGSVIEGLLTTVSDPESREGDVHKAMNGSAYVALQFTKESEQPTIARHIAQWHRRKLQFRQDPVATRYLQSRMRGGALECNQIDDDSIRTTNSCNANNSTALYDSLLNRSSFKASYIDLNTYDAVLAFGIAACQTPDFTTQSLYDTLKHVEFFGASYHVAFNTTTCSRRADSFAGFLFNILIDNNNNNNNKQ
ncbi:expressed unknown protein [Seminavis robusta]|uniref:Receptor ligand binding region domain-containing protein n=1 Tax=Seminavis robusta TaxID=568900 RepID=A0A9N8E9P0_9STRA|nr:expressed unknown protein [Seminavis robusta]|eukprot:Sro829_g208130.1 n/a (434) ;mRNA; r:30700-32001